jgi:hypothetical protein
MAPISEAPTSPTSAPEPGPVFVDATGRRLRRAQLAGRVALGLVAGYVALVVAALLGAPNVAAPFLPQPAPPSSEAQAPGTSDGRAAGPAPEPTTFGDSEAAVLAAPVPAPQASAAATAAPLAGQPGAAPAPTAQLPAAVPAPTAAPAPQPTASGKSLTAPGQSNRPTSPQHP